MELRVYLAKQRVTIKDFCEKIGYSRNQISGIINERYRPSARLAKLIEEATNGEVKADELLKQHKEGE